MKTHSIGIQDKGPDQGLDLAVTDTSIVRTLVVVWSTEIEAGIAVRVVIVIANAAGIEIIVTLARRSSVSMWPT